VRNCNESPHKIRRNRPAHSGKSGSGELVFAARQLECALSCVESQIEGYFGQLCEFSESIVVLQAYFDESQRESGIFCVAGFAFATQQVKKFVKEWSALFAPYPGGLHMRDLTNRTRAFQGIDKREQERLIVKAARIISRRMSAGFAVSCNVNEVNNLAPLIRGMRGFEHAYSLCCYLSMIAVGEFLEKSGSSERVTYVFEAGHPGEAEAREFMRRVVQIPAIKETFRHSGDAFLPKGDAVPLQAADMLAWEWAKFRDETLEQRIRPMRKSLLALFENHVKQYSGAHITGAPLQKFVLQLRQMGLLELAAQEKRKRGES